MGATEQKKTRKKETHSDTNVPDDYDNGKRKEGGKTTKAKKCRRTSMKKSGHSWTEEPNEERRSPLYLSESLSKRYFC